MRSHSRVLLGIVATLLVGLALVAPASAAPANTSTFFTSLGFSLGDTILNGAINFVAGPLATILALVGAYKTYQNLHDAQHTGEYGHKAIFGYATMMMTAGGYAIYNYISKQAASGTTGMTIHAGILHHHHLVVALAHGLVQHLH